MSRNVGIWIDHKKAVIVSTADDGQVTVRTLESEVGAHPHFGGQQDGGGEKKYEERRFQDLDRYYDEVIGQLKNPDALLILGPGEAKLELKRRLGHDNAHAAWAVAVETADRLTEAQVVAKVKEHFEVAR